MTALKIPLSWLAEYVSRSAAPKHRAEQDCDLDVRFSVQDVLESLLRVGFEAEPLSVSCISGPIVVGRVLDYEEETHSNGKTIRWCRVKVAQNEHASAGATAAGDTVRHIVCGAHNFFRDDLVVVTLPGSTLADGMNVTSRTVYGHTSEGMIASERELGLGSDHDGILRLAEVFDESELAQIHEGDDAIALLHLADSAIEISVTPDRGYAMSIRGIAREYALANNIPFDDSPQREAKGDTTSDPRTTDARISVENSDPESEAANYKVNDAASAIKSDSSQDTASDGLAESEYGSGELRDNDKPLRSSRNTGSTADPQTHPPMLCGLPVNIVSPQKVFFTLLIRNLKRHRTPNWMVRRLQLAGVRSTSLAVDITNYVMIETGQPLHAYDYGTISGPLSLRPANNGEVLDAIDGKRLTLCEGDLVVADTKEVLSLAGVIGGNRSKVTSGTTNIILEAGNFDPVNITLSSRRHRVHTESSARFSRTVDPLIAYPALMRAASLLRDLAGGSITELGSAYVNYTPPEAIRLEVSDIQKIVGCNFTQSEVVDSLRAIGCDVHIAAHPTIVDPQVHTASVDVDCQVDQAAIYITPPSFRPDLVTVPDLAEEVIRVIGYDRIPSLQLLPAIKRGSRELTVGNTASDAAQGVPADAPSQAPVNTSREHSTSHGSGSIPSISFNKRNLLGQALASAGHTEVICYPFVSATAVSHIDVTYKASDSPGKSGPIRLHNPLDTTAGYLRRSLIPGLLQCAHRNLSRGIPDLNIFEIGRVFLGAPFSGKSQVIYDQPESCLAKTIESIAEVYQPYIVAVLQTGFAVSKQPFVEGRKYDLSDTFDSVRQIAWALGADFEFRQGKHHAFHPGRCAKIIYKHHCVGYAGQLLPTLAEQHNLPDNVFACEVNLDLVMQFRGDDTARNIGRNLLTGPASTQHLTLLLDSHIPAAEVEKVIKEGAGDLLEDIQLIDDYEQSDKRALTFSMRFRHRENKTLTAQQVNAAKENAVQLASTRLNAFMRR